MGCVASRLEEEEEVVSICRARKRLIKLAVERRYALADAHCRYCQSLYAVSAAIKLFVARHSSPPSPFLITLPPPCPSPSSPLPPDDNQNVISNPMFLQQRPSEATREAIKCESCGASTPPSSSEEEGEGEEETRAEEEEEEKEPTFGYFFMQMPPPMPMPSPQRDFGWDFFNPFYGMRPEILNAYQRCPNDGEDEHLRVVREQEGIPDLEEEGEEKKVVVSEENRGSNTNKTHEENNGKVVKVVDDGSNNMSSQKEQKGLTVIDNPEMGRELLDALKDIEDHFIRAYNSGKDVSRMLEANMTRLESGMEEIRGGFPIEAANFQLNMVQILHLRITILIKLHSGLLVVEETHHLSLNFSFFGLSLLFIC